MILLFIISIIISYFYNYTTIVTNFYIGKFGHSRFIFQLIMLFIGLLVVYFIALTVNSYYKFYKTIIIMLLFFYIYFLFALFELSAYVFKGYFLELFKIVGSVIYPDTLIEYSMTHRPGIHSFSQEPSHLAMYVAIIAPYILSYSIYKKKYYNFFLVVLIILLSLSRLGYVLVFMEIFLILYLFKFKYFDLKKIFIAIFMFFLFTNILFAIPIIGETILSLINVKEIGSNAARYAAAYSALQVWLNHNIFLGVGLGQTGFYSVDYLPQWGFLSGDVVDTNNGLRWPPIHNLLVRILTEIGLLGLIFWISVFIYMIFRLHRIIKIKYYFNKEVDWIAIGALVSTIATILIMFNRETFTNMSMWLGFGLSLAYINITKRIYFEKKTNN